MVCCSRAGCSCNKRYEEQCFETTKKHVLDFYNKNSDRILYPSDVAYELGLDPKDVFEVTESLANEGKLDGILVDNHITEILAKRAEEMGLGILRGSSCRCLRDHEDDPPDSNFINDYKKEIGPAKPEHSVSDTGDCLPWCRACGPECKHGDNSLECKKCEDEKFGMPNPKNYHVRDIFNLGGWTALKVEYPDAKNYEGVKILVLKATQVEIINAKVLDPHFCDSGHLSPFARFEPTAQGWSEAIELVKKFSASYKITT